MDAKQVTDWFAYTDGNDDETKRCIAVRTACAQLARVWVDNCPDGPDQTFALRKLKDTCQAMIGGIVKPIPR